MSEPIIEEDDEIVEGRMELPNGRIVKFKIGRKQLEKFNRLLEESKEMNDKMEELLKKRGIDLTEDYNENT